jgi:hypothetical protein
MSDCNISWSQRRGRASVEPGRDVVQAHDLSVPVSRDGGRDARAPGQRQHRGPRQPSLDAFLDAFHAATFASI